MKLLCSGVIGKLFPAQKAELKRCDRWFRRTEPTAPAGLEETGLSPSTTGNIQKLPVKTCWLGMVQSRRPPSCPVLLRPSFTSKRGR